MLASDGRAYGRACMACRSRKRKCRPGSQGEGRCEFCEANGHACESTSKRSRRAAHEGLGAESTSRQMTSLGEPGWSPPASLGIGLGDLDHNIDLEQSIPGSMPMAPETVVIGSGSYTYGPAPEQEGELGSLPMAVGHGAIYHSSVHDLVSRVCGTGTVEPVNELLATYFAWQEPQHMPVDEDLFRRDMTARPTGPYYSPLLLHAIHAQASRHLLSHQNGWAYADRASALLIAGLSDLPSITTIQALLIMAGREVALGASSAGWLKSGMALRMLEELGLERDAFVNLEDVPDQDRETVYMRQRTFWSAYSWDKFFAMTLGRQPAMHRTIAPSRVPHFYVPESYPWQPYGTNLVYPPSASLTGVTFHALCLLNIELGSILQRLYGYRSERNLADRLSAIEVLRESLLAWRSRVSPQILLDTSYLPSVCPPPHILTLNILYRTTWILLLRRSSAHDRLDKDARRACLARSAEIHLLFKLHEATFELQNLTYITAYSAYVSATVDVAEAMFNHTGMSAEATSRLELTLKVLTKAAHHTPGIQRSIAHLKQRLNRSRQSQSELPSGATTPTTAHPSGQMTAVSTDMHTRPDSISDPFGALPLGASFEELFAALLPEYASGPSLNEDIGSTADLSMMQDDWFSAFELETQ